VAAAINEIVLDQQKSSGDIPATWPAGSDPKVKELVALFRSQYPKAYEIAGRTAAFNGGISVRIQVEVECNDSCST
jgi:hypothetical protein